MKTKTTFQNQDLPDLMMNRILAVSSTIQNSKSNIKKMAIILKILAILLILIQTAHAQTWQSVYQKADSLMKIRLFKESIPFYEQALPLAKKEFGKESENYLKTRNGLGRSITFVKKKEEIEPFLLENMELCKKYGEKTAIYAQALHNVGTFYSPIEKGNNPTKCEDYLKQVLVLRKELNESNTKNYASTLYSLALCYRYIGNNQMAEPLLKEALQVHKLLSNENRAYIQTLSVLAFVYIDLGKYLLAEPLLQELLQITPQKHPFHLSAIQDLGYLYLLMGNYQKAELFYQNIRNENTKDESYKLTTKGLADLYLQTGNYTNSLILYKEALQLFYQKNVLYRDCSTNLALVYKYLGQYYLADSLSKQCLSSLALENKKLNIYTAPFYSRVANIQIDQKKYTEAEENFLKTIKFIENSQEKGSLLLLESKNDLVRLYQQTCQFDKALPLFLEIKNRSLSQIQSQFPNLSETEKERFFDNRISPYFRNFNAFVVSTTQNPQGFKNLTGLKNLKSEMYNLQLSTKALLLNASAKWKHNIMTSGDKRLVSKFLEWESMKNRLTVIYQQEDTDKKLVDSLENQANELEKQLSKISERFRACLENRKT